MRNCILVADDDPVTRQVLRRILEQAGYQVAEACDGQETLDKVRELQPRLLLLDITMPHLNGFQVCQQVREREKWRRMPIVMLTGSRQIEDMRTGLVTGADLYITKPVRAEEILQDVHSFLATSL